jgi:hypothetical protein
MPFTSGTIIPLQKGEERVLGFFGYEGAAAALEEKNFDQHEEMKTIIDLIRAEEPGIQLGALRHFRQVLRDISRAQGAFATSQRTTIGQDDRGRLVRHIESTTRLLDRLQQENQNVRETFSPHQIIEPIPVEQLLDTASGENPDQPNSHLPGPSGGSDVGRLGNPASGGRDGVSIATGSPDREDIVATVEAGRPASPDE